MAAGYTTTHRRPVVQFIQNVPVEIRLKWTDGKPMPSAYPDRPDQVMFTTINDEVMFVDEAVANKIRMIQPQAGVPFWIIMRKHGRTKVWDIFRNELGSPIAPVGSNPAMGANEAGLPQDASPLERDLARSLDRAQLQRQGGAAASQTQYQPPMQNPPPYINQRPVSRPQAMPQTAMPQTAVDQRSHNYWVAPDQQQPPQAPHPADCAAYQPPAPQNTVQRPVARNSAAPEWTGMLVEETNALTDAFAASIKYATERHGSIVKADDVRSLLLSAFINRSKGVR